jgi:cytochrome c peroxidase
LLYLIHKKGNSLTKFSGRFMLFTAALISLMACGYRSLGPENTLSVEEEDQIFQMAKSYFLPLPEIDWTAYSETDRSKVLLGKALFYDKKLSKNQTQNCASCHDMNRFGQDNLRVSPGDAGVLGVRNVPTVLNAFMQFAQLWDTRVSTVEEQSARPVFGDVEMGMTDTLELLERLWGDPKYPGMFRNAFPGSDTLITLHQMKTALGAFERTLLTPARFDDYLKGNRDALSTAEKKGIKSFINQGCIPCHSGALLGGNMAQEFSVYGYYWDYTNSTHLDKGRYEHTLKEEDMFVFKVPGLRNVTQTGPYFHDGSVSSLEESIYIMGLAELNTDLSDEEVTQIAAFFNSLTGEVPGYAFEEGSFPFEEK